MIIKSLKLVEDNDSSFDIFNITNLIYSNKNSKGKSTYIRLLFYSLGYQVPSMYGLDFSKVKTEIVIEEKGIIYTLNRNDNFIDSYCENNGLKYTYSLPNEHIALLQVIFNTDNVKILNNLLGILYVDQEKGWTLLNRGVVIGRLRFSVEELISGLSEVNCDKLIAKKKKLIEDEEKFLSMLDIDELSREIIEKNGEIFVTKEEEELEAKNALINLKIQNIKNSIKEIDSAIKNDENFFKFIDSMELQVVNNGTIIDVTRENIQYSSDNIEYLRIRKSILSLELNNLLNEKIIVNNKLKQFYEDHNEINSLFGEPIEKQIDRQLSRFNFDRVALQNLLDETRKQKKEINNQIKSILKTNNSYIQKIYNYVKKYAEILGVDNKISEKKDFIFTSDLKGLSGAVLQKMVISFKLAFLKVIEEKLGTKLFMVLDSPRGRELDEDNAIAILNLIKDELKENQIVVASIYKDIEYDNVIKIKNYAIENNRG